MVVLWVRTPTYTRGQICKQYPCDLYMQQVLTARNPTLAIYERMKFRNNTGCQHLAFISHIRRYHGSYESFIYSFLRPAMATVASRFPISDTTSSSTLQRHCFLLHGQEPKTSIPQNHIQRRRRIPVFDKPPIKDPRSNAHQQIETGEMKERREMFSRRPFYLAK